MKKMVFGVLPFLLFISCEDEEAMEQNPLLGTWNYVATEYDETCSGDGEVWETGTMVFTDTDLSISYVETFEDWCDGVVEDTICYEDATLYLSDWQDECDGVLNEDECSITEDATYTYTDSLYITIEDTFHIPESISYLCEDEGGSYLSGVCYLTLTNAFSLVLDGNSGTWSEVVSDDEEPYCDVFVLTKQ